MIALYIVGAVILLIIVLMHSPFKIFVECNDNKLSVKLKYLFWKKSIFPKEDTKQEIKSTPKTSKTARSSKKNTSANKKKSDKKKKKLFPEKKEDQIAFIINILKSSGKALKVFTKRITIRDITADISISDEDACDCAVKFGKSNIIIYNLLSFCAMFFKIKKNYINIRCVYNKPKSIYNFSFMVKFSPSAGILSAFAFIITFLVNNKRSKKQSGDTRTSEPPAAAEQIR